jgi:hypothetical protein
LKGPWYLELGSRVGRIGSEQLEHVDDAANGPGAYAIVLVLQQALVRQFLRDGHERVAMCLFLVYGAQLVEQRLEARQQVAHADLLSRTPNEGLLEGQFLEAGILSVLLLLLLLLLLLRLFVFDYFSDRRRAPPTARRHVAWWLRALEDACRVVRARRSRCPGRRVQGHVTDGRKSRSSRELRW